MKNKKEDILVNVAVPVSQYTTYVYKIPQEIYQSIGNKELIGRRVLVPFRKSGYTGIITEINPDNKIKNFKIKDIEDIPDKEPVFSSDEVEIIKKISDYYITPIGLSFYYFLPDGLRWKKENGKWINKPSQERIYYPKVLTVSGLEKISSRGLELLEILLERGELTKKEIKELGFSESVIKTLEKRDLITSELLIFKESKLKQEIKEFKSTLEIKKGFFVFSSKKIEERINTYIKIINRKIEEKRGSLIIFPNVKSAVKFYETYKGLYSDKIFLYHDGIPEKEKIKIWFNLKKLKGTITVGTFSSLLIPIKDLDLLILEEEHSESYKLMRTPRLDVRRLCYEIYSKKNCTLIFSSSVPSVETEYSLKTGLSKSFEDENILKREIEIKVFPLEKEKIFQKKLLEYLNDNSKTTLIIANKKAYASFLYCERCDEEILCERCDVPLKVYKKDEGYLKCELCGTKYQTPEKCPVCDYKLIEIGFGIQKVEKILKEKFKKQISYLEEDKNTRIKITTSVIDKEFLIPDFDNVVNIYPDFLLNINDFRGNEKYYRNIVYPYLKAKEKYILITNNRNFSLDALIKQNPDIFYEKELQFRKKFKMPPFSKYILLTFQKKEINLKKVKEIFDKWRKEENIEKLDFIGPFYAYYTNIRGITRVQILLKNFKEKEKLKNLYEQTVRKGIKLVIDVDPRQML